MSTTDVDDNDDKDDKDEDEHDYADDDDDVIDDDADCGGYLYSTTLTTARKRVQLSCQAGMCWDVWGS